jgi:hypothetical protein
VNVPGAMRTVAMAGRPFGRRIVGQAGLGFVLGDGVPMPLTAHYSDESRLPPIAGHLTVVTAGIGVPIHLEGTPIRSGIGSGRVAP